MRKNLRRKEKGWTADSAFGVLLHKPETVSAIELMLALLRFERRLYIDLAVERELMHVRPISAHAVFLFDTLRRMLRAFMIGKSMVLLLG
jgi:hypothetical protein